MKFSNLFQDPASDSEAPYADTLILDAGGLDVRYGGEAIAHVSFEDIDPFELAFHAMPDDWEPHPEWIERGEDMITFIPRTTAELLENSIYTMLNRLGEARGWQRS